MTLTKAELAAALAPFLRIAPQLDVPLREHTTWRIGGPADVLATPSDEDELAAVLAFVHENHIPWLVIGNGSNLLVADRGVRGVVVKMAEPFSRAVWRGEEVEAMAGMLLAALALEAAERGLQGLEFARGIPGSVGGGVRMNAGAYDGRLGDFVTGVTAVDYRGKRVTLGRDEITFAYRNSSLFDLDAVITRVSLRLQPGERDEIMARMKDYSQRRSLAQPLEFPSCGSVFRNPEGDHAGHLIEMAGLRGVKINGAEVSQKHGNFIINRGNATAADVRELIELVQERVYAYAGVRLTPEVKFVGDFSDCQ